MSSHPMQPVEHDPAGVIRFKHNTIVQKLLEVAKAHGYGLNEIVRDMRQGKYDVDDLVQLDQLIGYSVSGFGDLSYIPKRVVSTADRRAYKLCQKRETT